MTKRYKIRITDRCGIIMLSPEIITVLIEKVRNSDIKEFVIPAEEIFPQGYTEYLTCVLAANTETKTPKDGMRKVYELAAVQIKKLSVRRRKCFDKVSIRKLRYQTQFSLAASKTFYTLAKQKMSCFVYYFKDFNKKEIMIDLTVSK